MNWQPGDIAICINASPLAPYREDDRAIHPMLKVGSEYIIRSVHRCPACQHMSLDVGIPSTHHPDVLCVCKHKCKNDGIWLLSAGRFVKRQAQVQRMTFKEREVIEADKIIERVEVLNN